jgi:hypothetical protein
MASSDVRAPKVLRTAFARLVTQRSLPIFAMSLLVVRVMWTSTNAVPSRVRIKPRAWNHLRIMATADVLHMQFQLSPRYLQVESKDTTPIALPFAFLDLLATFMPFLAKQKTCLNFHQHFKWLFHNMAMLAASPRTFSNRFRTLSMILG